MNSFETRAVHGDGIRNPSHGALRPPIHESVSFEYEKAADLEAAFAGRKPAHSYSRISNPTVAELENRIRLLTGAVSVLAVSSGMAAISNVVLALAGAGTNLVTSRTLFGNTWSLFARTLEPWGLEVRAVDFREPEAVRKALDGKTRLVFAETITNPGLHVADLSAISGVTKAMGVPLVVDATLTPPCLFRSRDHGVDVEILSSTKSISGGGTAVGGLIVDHGSIDAGRNPRLKLWAAKAGRGAFSAHLRMEVFRNLGACLSAHNASLHLLGLETLAMRVDMSCANALELARRLQSHPRVASVDYPGLPSSPSHETAMRQFSNRGGSLLTFRLEDKASCFAFMDRLRIVRRATNLQDNKTLVLHPASTIFAEYGPDEREALGAPENLVRLSTGIEDVEDLWDDLKQALEA